jgi:hypothetical protein
MNSIDKLFPDFMKIELCKELIDRINSIIETYKKDTTEAVIYSMIENKTIKSNRRISHKKSFHSDELKTLLDRYIGSVIYSMLKEKYPTSHYDVSIGTQAFDYIKYDNGGYFDKHKDFVRINNCRQRQYTMLIGLTSNTSSYGSGGNTILWFPVDTQNKEDYDKLTETILLPTNPNLWSKENIDNYPELITLVKKYNLPNNIDLIKKLLETNTTDQKYMPYFVNCFGTGKSLLFRSDIVHSGEEFYNWYCAKELLMITVNITGIEDAPYPMINCVQDKINYWLNDRNSQIIMFDDFECSMCSLVKEHTLFPFQIIVSRGEYNNKNFSDIYVKYLNLQDDMRKVFHDTILERINSTLIEIYAKTKDKLNGRGRETHISSEILEESTNISHIEKLNGIRFDTTHIRIDEVDLIEINNYVNIVSNNISNNSIVSHVEKINNRWEESSCNDDGDEYDETTYLHCNIDIKFCFMKP